MAQSLRLTARVLGQEREAGTIEVGKRADLIVVAGHPLERIGDIPEDEIRGQGRAAIRLHSAQARGRVPPSEPGALAD